MPKHKLAALALSGFPTPDGTPGDDLITGGWGINNIGVNPDETIHGNAGNDTLVGGYGNDSLFGDDGNDVLGTDAGSDQLSGGAGSDTFTFSGLWEYSANTVAERDHVMDFEAQDKIDFRALGHVDPSQIEVQANGSDWRVLVHLVGQTGVAFDVGLDVTGVQPTEANFILS